MKNWMTRILTFGLAVAFCLTAVSQASAARRAGLHGNALIKDVTDIATFPQAAADYSNLMRIDSDASSALFVVGDDSATYAITAGASDPAHPTVLDMVYAMPMGADALGIGLTMGMGGVSPDGGDATSDMAMGLTVGFTMSAMNLETALSVQMDSTDDGAGNTTSAMDINLAARGYSSLGEATDLGYIASVQSSSAGSDADGTAGDGTSSLDVAVGAGPVYKMDKGQVAAYGVLGFHSGTNTPAVGDETSDSALLFPGFEVAAEVQLSESLVWRGGAGYGYASLTDGGGNGSKAGAYSWASGLGYKWDNFQIDGTVSNDFYNRGPNFISGQAGDLFGDVALSYSF